MGSQVIARHGVRRVQSGDDDGQGMNVGAHDGEWRGNCIWCWRSYVEKRGHADFTPCSNTAANLGAFPNIAPSW